MKRKLALILAIVMVLTLGLSLTACQPKAAQGVDTKNHVIKVGNTAATTGSFAGVGVPFNYGLEAYLWYFSTQTDGYKDAAGNKYTFDFVHYDDGFVAADGITYTEKLVEEDKIFALVGHFGTNTVAATMDYVEAQGIPMVYGVTGVSNLLDTERNAMTVQPIYDTEGASMVATAIAPTEGGMGLGASKVGVIITTDDAGRSMERGIIAEASKLGLVEGTDIFYVRASAATGTDYSYALNYLKGNNCDVVIVAANQVPFGAICKQFDDVSYDNVKILTSYVGANATLMGTLVAEGVMTETRRVFTGTWLYTGAAPTDTKGWNEFVDFVKVMTLYSKSKSETLLTTSDTTYGALINYYFGTYDWAAEGVSAYFLNSYTMAGYVAGNVFCQGLTRVSGEALTWAAYIDAMESEPVNIPMGLTINYAKGNRKGIEALAVNEYTATNFISGALYRNLTPLADIEAAIEAAGE